MDKSVDKLGIDCGMMWVSEMVSQSCSNVIHRVGDEKKLLIQGKVEISTYPQVPIYYEL